MSASVMRNRLLALLCAAPISGWCQNPFNVNAQGVLRGRDGVSRPVAVASNVFHQANVADPKVAILQAGPVKLEGVRLEVSRSGAPQAEFFLFMSIFRSGPPLGSFARETPWVQNNTGEIVVAEVDTRTANAVLVDTATLPQAISRSAGASFLARVEIDDVGVQASVVGTYADMRGVRLGLEDAMSTLRDAINGQFDSLESLGENYTVSKTEVLYVPHDDGRIAAPFILSFKVRKTFLLDTKEATLLIPVSFVFSRNAAGDGFNITVNPADTINKKRITALHFNESRHDIDLAKIRTAAKSAVGNLPAGFYEVPRERLERAVRNVRPARPVPQNFNIIIYPNSRSDGTTSANNPIQLRVLE